jgi:5-(carboxyamino)imidazole ribonucleotide mutase
MKPIVRIIAGSKSDMEYVEICEDILEHFDVSFDTHISSSHRNPERTRQLAQSAEQDGIKVIIALAGMSAALPGYLASWTTLPVIGVPLPGSALNGVDSLYSIVQMPGGIPVAGVGIGKSGAKNAAYLAIAILSLQDEGLKDKLKKYRASWNENK